MSIVGLAAIAKPEPWVDGAICPQVGDGDLWFPAKGNQAGPAKRICLQCPVRADCLEYALRNKIREGIYGGFSPTERESLNRRRNPLRNGRPPGRRGHSWSCRCIICQQEAA